MGQINVTSFERSKNDGDDNVNDNDIIAGILENEQLECYRKSFLFVNTSARPLLQWEGVVEICTMFTADDSAQLAYFCIPNDNVYYKLEWLQGCGILQTTIDVDTWPVNNHAKVSLIDNRSGFWSGLLFIHLIATTEIPDLDLLFRAPYTDDIENERLKYKVPGFTETENKVNAFALLRNVDLLLNTEKGIEREKTSTTTTTTLLGKYYIKQNQ